MTPENKLNSFASEFEGRQPEIYRPLSVDVFFGDYKGAEERRSLVKKFETIFKKIEDPEMEIEEARNRDLVATNEVIDLYNNFSDFIGESLPNSRLILYFPFQLIPNLNETGNKPDDLIEAEKRFAEVYKESWIRLLFVSDVRADFCDGDILEPGLGNPEKVRKAAHLASEILRRGIILKEDIDMIIELNSTDELLCRNLNEGLVTTEGLIKNDRENIKSFNLEEFRNELKAVDEKYGFGLKRINFVSLEEKYKSISPDTEISKQRAVWLRKVERKEVFEKYAAEITDFDLIDSLIKTGEVDNILLALKAMFNRNEVDIRSESLIESIWQKRFEEFDETIITGVNCWYRKKIISAEYSQKLGIKLPDLSQIFPLDLEKSKNPEFKMFLDIVEEIKKDPILVKNIFPTVLLFGSMPKGYASIGSDIDIAVFFRPGIEFEDRDKIMSRLRTIRGLNNIGRICEIWTKEDEGKIKIKSIPGNLWGILGLEKIQFVFNGIWFGGSEETEKLRQDLMERYFNLSGLGDKKDSARYILLNELESDILQYRLMHKGYRKFYPDGVKPEIKKNRLINGNSTFWDPDFRRIATKLFLGRVFLPDLS